MKLRICCDCTIMPSGIENVCVTDVNDSRAFYAWLNIHRELRAPFTHETACKRGTELTYYYMNVSTSLTQISCTADQSLISPETTVCNINDITSKRIPSILNKH